MHISCHISLFLLVTFSSATAAQNSLTKDISDTKKVTTINIKNNLLTLKVKDQSLTDTLNLITKHHQVRFSLPEKLNPTLLDLEIIRTPLDEAIHSLLKNHSVIMYYESTSNDKTSELSRVEVLNRYAKSLKKNHQLVSKKTIYNDKDYQQVDNLQGLNDPLTIRLLSNNLRNNINPKARMRAIELLENIGTTESKQAVESALGDKNISVRKLTLNLISKRHNEQSILFLGQVLNSDPDTKMRTLALKNLSTFNSSNAKIFIKSALKDNDEQVRNMALKLHRK